MKNGINNKNRMFSKIDKKVIFEYIKYNLIGTINFTTCQVIYIILLTKFKINYVIAYTVCNIISICISYLLNTKITFKEEKYSVKRFVRVYVSHLFEYILNLAIVTILIEICSVSQIISPMIAPIITTPIIFILVKKSIKKES